MTVSSFFKGCFITKVRWQIAIMAHIGIIISLGIRANFGVAKSRMISNFTDAYGIQHSQEFFWTPTQVGWLESSFFYGYAISQVPAGFFCVKYPADKLFGIGVFIAGLANILIGFGFRFHPYSDCGIMFLQVIQGVSLGFMYPAVGAVLSRWAPPMERSKLATTTYTGGSMGVVIGIPTTAALISYFHWSAPFYVFGLLGIIWAICWNCIASRSPETHSYVSEEELDYINLTVGKIDTTNMSFLELPWKSIFCSLPVWAISFANFSRAWTFFLLLGNQIQYMNNFLKIDIRASGLYATLPQILSAITMIFYGHLADYLRSTGKLSTETVRKLFNTFGFSWEAFFLCILSFTTTPWLAIIFLMISSSGSATVIPGFNVNHFDIAPRYASLVVGLSNGFGSLAGLSSYITQNLTLGNPSNWRYCFLIAMCVDLFSVVFFLIFAKGDVQDWAKEPTPEAKAEIIQSIARRLSTRRSSRASKKSADGSASYKRKYHFKSRTTDGMVYKVGPEGFPSVERMEKIEESIKKHAVAQFINIVKASKNLPSPSFKWGDETEYTIVKFDDVNKKVHASCRSPELLEILKNDKGPGLWSDEFTIYIIESCPSQPWEDFLECFKQVEDNMAARRRQLEKYLSPDERLLTTSFPSVGVADYTYPKMVPTPDVVEGPGQSIFVPETVVVPDSLRWSLVSYIRARRGEKIGINVPIYKDINTPSPYIEDLSAYQPEAIAAAKPDHIFMDHMAFGLSNCCIQVTFQASSMDEALWIYDQIHAFNPILLALTASTPIYKSTLSDFDARWNVISQSIDDRSQEERGLNSKKPVLTATRYGTLDHYSSPTSTAYNDVPFQYKEDHVQELMAGGIDEALAKHIANLFVRNPWHTIQVDRVDDEKNSEHCYAMMHSVLNDVKLKPPTLDCIEAGWKVEIRPMDLQLTDFQNSAFCCFAILLTRMIIKWKLSTLLPASAVLENMNRAYRRDAVLDEKFYFRTDLFINDGQKQAEMKEMTVNEIINGGENFEGLLRMLRRFLNESNVKCDTRCKIEKYLEFISKRASGEVRTVARWIRGFVDKHADYKKDSRVSDSTIYDLLKTMDDILNGRIYCDELLGKRKC